MPLSQSRMVLLTGATGFVGARLAKGLLDQGHTVLALLRPRARVKGGALESVASRVKALHHRLGLDPEASARLIPLEGDLASLNPKDLGCALTAFLAALGRPARLDAVVHAAARLQMDHPGQSAQKRVEIRARNLRTNVHGLRNLLSALEVFGVTQARPSLRVLRPSIIAGAGSRDAYMAFLTYLNQRLMGVGILDVGRRLARRLPPGVVVPLPGNPEGTLDIVDVDDVVRTTLALLEVDLRAQRERDSALGSFLLLSTAYAHGHVQGTQLECALGPLGELSHRNAYEESKALAESVLEQWAGPGDKLRYNHLCSARPPSLQEVAETTLAAFGWEQEQTQRLSFVSPGPDFVAKMTELRGASPLAYAIADGLWQKLPMLVAYLNRPSDVAFAHTNTAADLQTIGLQYTPRSFDQAYVRDLVASLD